MNQKNSQNLRLGSEERSLFGDFLHSEFLGFIIKDDESYQNQILKLQKPMVFDSSQNSKRILKHENPRLLGRAFEETLMGFSP